MVEKIAVMSFAFFDLINVHACNMLASSPARTKNGEAPGTLFVHAFNLPKMWGLWAIFRFFRVM